MSDIDERQPSGERLDSWKAIADYLRRDAATVRRWEKTQGLPVRRVRGGPGRSVFAYTSEIDAWLNAGHQDAAGADPAPPNEPTAPNQRVDSPALPAQRTRFQRLTPGAAALAAIAIALVVALQLRASNLDVTQLKLTVSSDGVIARDPAGRERWRYDFPASHRTALLKPIAVSRVVGGSDPAVFVGIEDQRRRLDDRVESGRLLWLTPEGQLRRSFQFDDRITFGGIQYSAPWALTAFGVDDRNGRRRIAVAAHHYEWSPSMVAILDERFQRLGTYVQSGWIESVHWLAPDRLLVGGFSNPRDGGMVAIIDPNALDAQAPEAPGTLHYCETCGTRAPLRVVVMPRTELNRITASRFNRALVQVMPDGILVRTVEVPAGPQNAQDVDVLYEFSPALELIRATFSDNYWSLHDALFAQGKLTHGSDACPAHAHPREITVWTPATGWKTIPAAGPMPR